MAACQHTDEEQCTRVPLVHVQEQGSHPQSPTGTPEVALAKAAAAADLGRHRAALALGRLDCCRCCTCLGLQAGATAGTARLSPGSGAAIRGMPTSSALQCVKARGVPTPWPLAPNTTCSNRCPSPTCGSRAHRRWMISKNTVGRSPSGLVKIWSSTPCSRKRMIHFQIHYRFGQWKRAAAQHTGAGSTPSDRQSPSRPPHTPPANDSLPTPFPLWRTCPHLVILVHKQPQLLNVLVLQHTRRYTATQQMREA